MSEVEVSTNNGSDNTPQSLKYLASNVEFFEGNSLLHQVVLDDCFSKNSVGERCLNAVLLSISGASVNELNDDGYSALHLAVLKENVLMVKMLLSRVRNIDVNLKSDACPEYWRDGKNAALHLATNLGNLLIIGELLNKGADVNVKNGCERTSLQLAIVSRNLETVKFLLEKGAIVNTQDENGFDTFHYAIEFYCIDIFKELLHRMSCNFPNFDFNICIRKAASRGNADAVQILVDKGCDVNALSERFDSVLHLAVRSGDFKTIECIIRNGANANALNKYRESVLHLAAGEICDWDTFKFLFDKCDHVIKNDPTLLHQAARSGCLTKVALMVNKNTDVNTIDRCFPLHQAIQSGDLETINFLLDANADVNGVNGDGESALCIAVQCGNLNVINLLMRKGAILNVENIDFPLLCFAARSGDLAVVEFILDQCTDVNVKDIYGYTPMYYAVLGNHVCVIKSLLDRGSNVDSVNTDHNPLHIAVRCEKTEAAQTLLERGCQVNAKDNRGYTPLIFALENRVTFDSDIVNLMFKWGAVIDGSPKGNTALHYACLMSNFKPDIFDSLLKGPADVCSTNAIGKTPLHYAATINNVGVLRLLVEKGADLNAKDVNGDTPLHYASRRRHTKFVKALLKRRAEVDVKGLHGRTPLHLAVIHFEDDIFKALLHSGANVNTVDDFGKTAQHYEEEPLYESEGYSEEEYESEEDTEENYESEGNGEDEPLQ